MDFFEMVDEKEFLREVRASAEVNAGLDKLAKEVKAYWQEIAPIESGDYAASVQVRDWIKKDKDGMPMRRVSSTDPAAHIIEYGSVDTPKFATRAKVATHFGYEPEKS